MNIEDLKGSAHEVDVIVHINEHLDQPHRTHLEDAIKMKAGITKARFNTQRHHLMIVAYDRKRINSATVLNYIKHQEVSAQLIGGI